MLANVFKKKEAVVVSVNSIPLGVEDKAIVNLTYVEVPQTLEMRKRQYEEQLREKYNIPKEKTGKLL